MKYNHTQLKSIASSLKTILLAFIFGLEIVSVAPTATIFKLDALFTFLIESPSFDICSAWTLVNLF